MRAEPPMFDIDTLREAARREGGISRRLFLAYGAGLSALPWLAGHRRPRPRAGSRSRTTRSASAWRRATRRSTGVVLWTRLAPRPLEPGGGMPPETVEVGWEVAGDEAMKDVVRRRRPPSATPQLGHSVHVEVERARARPLVLVSLPRRRRDQPGRPHPDRCPRRRPSPSGSGSPSPRASTTSRGCSPPTSTWPRTSSTWCSTWATTSTSTRAGTSWSASTPAPEISSARRLPHPPRPVQDRPAPPGGARPLPLDRDLGRPRGRQQLRRRHLGGDGRRPGRRSSSRRANAYQAYYEMMPLRPAVAAARAAHAALPQAVRSAGWPSSMVLDTRQYRTDQPNGDRRSTLNEAALDPQEHPARRPSRRAGSRPSLLASTATWNVLAQQVMMGMVDRVPRRGRAGYSMDQWPGYAARADAAGAVPRRPAGAEPGRPDRRHPLELGQRPARRRPQARDAGGRHRVRRHVDLQRRQRDRPRPKRLDGAAGREPVRPVPQRPARLRPLHGHPRRLAERLRRRRGRHQRPAPRRSTRASFVVEAGKPGVQPA